MKHKNIDISQCHSYLISEDCAIAVIDWRIQTKKGITQRIFDNALKQAVSCLNYGMTAEEALDRWMESGWTGMKWVIEEAKRSAHQEVETRKTSLEHDLTDLSWTNNATDYTRVN